MIRILIVEDEAVTRMVLDRQIGKILDAVIDKTDRLSSALKLISENEYDAILLDLNLLDCGSLNTVDCIRAIVFGDKNRAADIFLREFEDKIPLLRRRIVGHTVIVTAETTKLVERMAAGLGIDVRDKIQVNTTEKLAEMLKPLLEHGH